MKSHAIDIHTEPVTVLGMRRGGTACSERSQHALPILTLAAALALADRPAFALGEDPNEIRAVALFEEGKTAMDSGHFAVACPKLAASQALDPQLGTMLNLALCYETIGRRRDACLLWREAVSTAARKPDPRRESFARERADQLCSTLATLTVDVAPQPAVDRIVITVNGEPLPPAQWNNPTLRDPGEYEVRAMVAGRGTWAQLVRTHAGEASLVAVPVLVPESQRGAGITATLPLEKRTQGLSNAAWVSGGVGLLAVGVGASFGIAALADLKASNSDHNCVVNNCNDAGARARSRARDDAHIADASFAVGAGALATSVVLWVLARRAPAGGAGMVIRPSVAQGAWSVAIADSW